MRRLILAALLALPPVTARAETAHDFTFARLDDGAPLPLSDFAGKSVLLVNTASFCGYTRQYRGLEALWRTYKDRGLVVLGVPSNDFNNQEPGTAAEIRAFCTEHYDVTFPLTEKVHVKGPEAHPFYQWVASQRGAEALPEWNFHKYLIGPDGALLGTFRSGLEPGAGSLMDAIEKALPGN